jgi:transcription termination factor Rho
MENRLQKPKDITAKETTKEKEAAKETQQTIDTTPKPVEVTAPVTPEKVEPVVSPAPKKSYSPLKDNHARDSKHRSNMSDNKSRGQQQSTPNKPRPSRLMTELDLIDMQTNELNFVAKRLGIIGASLLSRDAVIKMILEYQEKPEVDIFVTGILEKLPDGFGFLRFSEYDYISGPDDVYVSPSFIRKYSLRTGDEIYGSIRKPKEGEKYFALQTIERVNNRPLDDLASRLNFDRLTPLHPDKKFNLETNPNFIATRIMDVFTPIGKGQRGLIVAPPKVGKTMLLKEIALSLLANHKEVHMIVLLIDERPEEVSDMKRTIKGANVEIVSSTFDESAERHVQVAEIVLEKAKRLVEYGKDVVILLDSITRLARAYNTTAPTSGKVLTGGIDAHALQRPKRFFGAARKTEEAGSLTIIASAMVETGSRMDEVIYEEFKGTGNMELHLTRKLSNRRTFPAFDILSSSTRRDDLLLSEDELNQAWILHRLLSTMNVVEGMEFIINKMKQYKTNEELFESLKKSGGAAGANPGTNGNGNGGSHHSSSSNGDYGH